MKRRRPKIIVVFAALVLLLCMVYVYVIWQTSSPSSSALLTEPHSPERAAHSEPDPTMDGNVNNGSSNSEKKGEEEKVSKLQHVSFSLHKRALDEERLVSHSERIEATRSKFLQQQQGVQRLFESKKKIDFENFWLQFVPVAECDFLARLGVASDGGKWVCNMHKIVREAERQNRTCVVYSFGSEYDISFDIEVNAQPYGCETHSFDPTISADLHSQSLKEGMKFHSIGLGPNGPANKRSSWKMRASRDPSQKQSHVPLMSLGQIVSKVTKDTKVDVLKIDIEYSEQTAIPYMLEEKGGTLLRELDVKLILLEIHALEEEKYAKARENLNSETFKKALLPLIIGLAKHGYYIFMNEANPHSICCQELAFMHESLL